MRVAQTTAVIYAIGMSMELHKNSWCCLVFANARGNAKTSVQDVEPTPQLKV